MWDNAIAEPPKSPKEWLASQFTNKENRRKNLGHLAKISCFFASIYVFHTYHDEFAI